MSTSQQLGGLQGQLVSHQGGTYLVQGGMMDGEGHPLTHTTRASPATVCVDGLLHSLLSSCVTAVLLCTY